MSFVKIVTDKKYYPFIDGLLKIKINRQATLVNKFQIVR